MKLFTLTSLILLSTSAFSEDAGKFAEHKAMMLERMKSTMACIEAATDKEAIKKCHQAVKEERAKMKATMIDSKIKKLEEEKNSLEEKK